MITTPLSFLFAKNAKYITRGISNIFERTIEHGQQEEIFEDSQMDTVVRNCRGILCDGNLFEEEIEEEIVLLLEINK